jgi:hypothetical protein
MPRTFSGPRGVEAADGRRLTFVLSRKRLSDATAGAPAPADELDHDLRTIVTIARTDPRDVGQRQVFVQIDQGPKHALRFGESLTEQVEPGLHRLRAHNTLVWKTENFAVESGEHLEFLVINHCGPVWQGIAAVLGAAPMFLKIRRRSLV